MNACVCPGESLIDYNTLERIEDTQRSDIHPFNRSNLNSVLVNEDRMEQHYARKKKKTKQMKKYKSNNFFILHSGCSESPNKLWDIATQ